MRLFNTLTRKIEEFQPREGIEVKLFVCGPTVYDWAHLGHAKMATQLDMLARVLRDQGYEVFYLQNITDIDDKIIARANEQGMGWEELRTRFETEYYKDMLSLNNSAVTRYARATDHIDNIIRQVQVLLDKGHAYVIDDGIYFEISTFADYGKLSGRQEIREDDAQTRIDQSDQKRGWNDFCLWKFSKPGEPVWEAPFGKGRPGWHIEDTAITEHFFGPQYDIHGGAVDLIFPHHEAEITQMESASGKVPFVRYWVHTGFLNIRDAKMSKSLGNFHTIREVIEKGYDPIAIRMLMLQTHYRSSINFSWDNLDAALNRLHAYRIMAERYWQPLEDGVNDTQIAHAKDKITRALADDLNLPQALAALSELEIAIDANGIQSGCQEAFGSFLSWIDTIFGLDLSGRQDISAEQKHLMEERARARAAQDWPRSDALRDQLAAQGIGVRDTPTGQVWSRTLPAART